MTRRFWKNTLAAALAVALIFSPLVSLANVTMFAPASIGNATVVNVADGTTYTVANGTVSALEKHVKDLLGLGFTVSGMTLAESSSNGITAFATGGQTNAAVLPSMLNRVTTVATIGDSVKLLPSVAGLEITVSNAGANAMDVFPATGDVINSLAANTAVRVNAGTTVYFVCQVAGTWHMSPATPPAAKYAKNTTSGATVAAAGDMTGAAYVSAEYSAVGTANLTTRTAEQMFADAGNVQPGDSYVLEIVNTSGGTTTLVAGTNVTLTGTMTLATNTTRRFNVKFTDATHLVIQSVGVGTIS